MGVNDCTPTLMQMSVYDVGVAAMCSPQGKPSPEGTAPYGGSAAQSQKEDSRGHRTELPFREGVV